MVKKNFWFVFAVRRHGSTQFFFFCCALFSLSELCFEYNYGKFTPIKSLSIVLLFLISQVIRSDECGCAVRHCPSHCDRPEFKMKCCAVVFFLGDRYCLRDFSRAIIQRILNGYQLLFKVARCNLSLIAGFWFPLSIGQRATAASVKREHCLDDIARVFRLFVCCFFFYVQSDQKCKQYDWKLLMNSENIECYSLFGKENKTTTKYICIC